MAPAPAPTPAPPSPVRLKRKRSDAEDLDDRDERDRRQAYGQPLPSWMSWARIPLTNAGGQVTGTATWLVELPQLYTGPSIPLGWPYTSQTGAGPDGGVQVSVLEGSGAPSGVLTLGGSGSGAIATAGETGTPVTTGTAPGSSGPTTTPPSSRSTGVTSSGGSSSPLSSGTTTSPSSSTIGPSSSTGGSTTTTSSSSTGLPGGTSPFNNHNNLSAGDIAGIALGSFFFFLLLVVGLAVLLVRRRRREARRNYMAAASREPPADSMDGDGTAGGPPGSGGRRAWIQGYRDDPYADPHGQGPEAGWKPGAQGATLGSREMGNLPPRSSQDGQAVDHDGRPVGATAAAAALAGAAMGRETDRLLHERGGERDLADGASSHYPSGSTRNRSLTVQPGNLRQSGRSGESAIDPDMTSPTEPEGERSSLLGVAAAAGRGRGGRRVSGPRSPRSPQDDPEWLGPGAIARAVGAYEVGRRALSFRSGSKSGTSSGRTGGGGQVADASSAGNTSVMTDELFAVPPGGAPRASQDAEAWTRDVSSPADRMGKDAVSGMGLLAGGVTAAAAARRRGDPSAIQEESESSSIDDPRGPRGGRRRSSDLPAYTPRDDGHARNRPSASSSRTGFTSSSYSDIEGELRDHQGRPIPHLVAPGSGWSTTFSPPVPYYPPSDTDTPMQGGGRVISIAPETFRGQGGGGATTSSSDAESSAENLPRQTKKRGSSIMSQWSPTRWGNNGDDGDHLQVHQGKRVSTVAEESESGSGTGSGTGDNSGSGSHPHTPAQPGNRLVSPNGGGTAGPLSAAGIGGLFGGLRAMVGGGKRDSGSQSVTPEVPEEEEQEDVRGSDHRHPILRHTSSQQRVTTSAMGFPEGDLAQLSSTRTPGERPVSHMPEIVDHPEDTSSELYRHPEEDSSQLFSSGEGYPPTRHASMGDPTAVYGEPNRWSHATMGQRIRDDGNQTSSSSGNQSSNVSRIPSLASSVRNNRKDGSGSGSGSGHGGHGTSGSGSGSGHDQGRRSSDSGRRPHPEAIQEERFSQIAEVPEVLSPS